MKQGLEFNGKRFHSKKKARERDRRKKEKAKALGIELLVIPGGNLSIASSTKEIVKRCHRVFQRVKKTSVYYQSLVDAVREGMTNKQIQTAYEAQAQALPQASTDFPEQRQVYPEGIESNALVEPECVTSYSPSLPSPAQPHQEPPELANPPLEASPSAT